MLQNIKDFITFSRRVRFLREPALLERGLEIVPDSFCGDFSQERTGELIRLVRQNPEYHLISYVATLAYVNGFVNNAYLYFLAEGDANPLLIHDPNSICDVILIQSLNSGRKSA